MHKESALQRCLRRSTRVRARKADAPGDSRMRCLRDRRESSVALFGCARLQARRTVAGAQCLIRVSTLRCNARRHRGGPGAPRTRAKACHSAAALGARFESGTCGSTPLNDFTARAQPHAPDSFFYFIFAWRRRKRRLRWRARTQVRAAPLARNGACTRASTDAQARTVWQHPFVDVFRHVELEKWTRAEMSGDVSAITVRPGLACAPRARTLPRSLALALALVCTRSCVRTCRLLRIRT